MGEHICEENSADGEDMIPVIKFVIVSALSSIANALQCYCLLRRIFLGVSKTTNLINLQSLTVLAPLQ